MIGIEHPTPSTPPSPRVPARLGGFLLGLALALVVGFLAGAGWARAATAPEASASVARVGETGAVALPPIRRELPREYREWLPKPIRFDHMYRQNPPLRYR